MLLCRLVARNGEDGTRWSVLAPKAFKTHQVDKDITACSAAAGNMSLLLMRTKLGMHFVNGAVFFSPRLHARIGGRGYRKGYHR